MDVAVQRDGAQVQNGRSGAHHVECDPRVTELRSEHPVTQQIIHHSEGHHQAGHEEVRNGKRRQEQVADAS